MVEDHVEFKGQRFRVVTQTSKDGKVHTKIVKLSDNEDDEATIFSGSSIKDKLDNLQQKALSYLFKVLNKDSNPDEKSFEEFSKEIQEDKSDSSKKEINNSIEFIEDDSFSKICKDILSKNDIGCFFIEGDKALSYFNELKDFNYPKDEILEKLSSIINFVKKNRDIKHLIGNWNFILYTESKFHIFASTIDNNIFIILNDTSMPMGYILKTNENVKSKFLEFSYLF